MFSGEPDPRLIYVTSEVHNLRRIWQDLHWGDATNEEISIAYNQYIKMKALQKEGVDIVPRF